MIRFNNIFFYVIIAIIIIVGFYTINTYSLCEWDESRNGVNAYEMIQNGHYFGLYYDGAIDTWNSKPPLMIWLIGLSYKVFGFSVFALRIPSYLAFLGTLYFLYKTIVVFESQKVALYSIGILATCKAFLGYHMAINGDFDMLLVFFLSGSIFHFIRFYFNNCNISIIYSAFFISCAFLTKGPAAFVYIPGLFILMLLSRQLTRAIKNFHFWIGIAVIILFIGIWYVNSRNYVYVGKSHYGSSNPIETLFLHDTFNRLFDGSFKSDTGRDFGFVFSVLESRFGIWLFAGIIATVLLVFVQKKTLKTDLTTYLKKPLVKLSICLSLPIIFLLTFSTNQNSWYLSPIFIFIAIILAHVLITLEKAIKFNNLYLLLFTLGAILQIYFLSDFSDETNKKLKNNPAFTGKNYYLIHNRKRLRHFKQNINLYFKWNGNTHKRLNYDSITYLNEREKLIISIDDYPLLEGIPIKLEDTVEEYIFFKLKPGLAEKNLVTLFNNR